MYWRYHSRPAGKLKTHGNMSYCLNNSSQLKTESCESRSFRRNKSFRMKNRMSQKNKFHCEKKMASYSLDALHPSDMTRWNECSPCLAGKAPGAIRNVQARSNFSFQLDLKQAGPARELFRPVSRDLQLEW